MTDDQITYDLLLGSTNLNDGSIITHDNDLLSPPKRNGHRTS